MNQQDMPKISPDAIQKRISAYKTVALVLQGGGALGAYQGGVFEALDAAKVTPNWVLGVSIGAINAAIIAGNRPEDRLARLKQFWATVSSRSFTGFQWPDDMFRAFSNQANANLAMFGGLPGFYRPRMINPFMMASGIDTSTSFYDTSDLKATLNGLIDWGRANSGEIRLSVGAVNVLSGNFRFFDTEHERLNADHIMASGALPPAFEAVMIDGEPYWDGGIVSNTPLQYLLEWEKLADTLALQVDLFSARGPMPHNMAAVLSRHKDIMYSSRTRNNTDAFASKHMLRLQLRKALLRLDENRLTEEDRAFLAATHDMAEVNIVHLIYQMQSYEGHSKDYEFSAASMADHWKAGLKDTQLTLSHPDWLKKPTDFTGLTIHDVHKDR